MGIYSRLNYKKIKEKEKIGLRSNSKKKNIFSKAQFGVFIICIFIVLILLFSTSCKKEEVVTKEEKEVFGPTYETGELIVNLADLGQARYAKIQVVLELDEEAVMQEVDDRSPQIRDIIIEIFSSKKAEELLDLEIRSAIKKEIYTKINAVLQDGSVRNIYFITLVVQ